MKRPQFSVDFNELLEHDLVALSNSDTRPCSDGKSVLLREGLEIYVYDEDLNDFGEPDNVIASGVVERFSGSGWTERIKWCCRIDSKGIRYASDLRADES